MPSLISSSYCRFYWWPFRGLDICSVVGQREGWVTGDVKPLHRFLINIFMIITFTYQRVDTAVWGPTLNYGVCFFLKLQSNILGGSSHLHSAIFSIYSRVILLVCTPHNAHKSGWKFGPISIEGVSDMSRIWDL